MQRTKTENPSIEYENRTRFFQSIFYTVSQKNVHLFIFPITLSKINLLKCFGVLNAEKIWHR